MAIVLEAPNELKLTHLPPSVFIAGCITGCGDWQQELIDKVKDVKNLLIYNPRRKNFPIDDPSAARVQITWEYDKLMLSDRVIMFFSKATLCPICLYELGRWINSSSHKKAFVAIENGYARTQDVIIQTSLSRPDVKVVVGELPDLLNLMGGWIENNV